MRSDSKLAAIEKMAVSTSVLPESDPAWACAASAQAKYRADAQDDPGVFASGVVEDVIESKGSEGRERRLEHRQYNIGAARSLACAAGVLAARDFGQRGDGDTGAKGHNQACVHGKAQGGRKAAREYDQFVE